ncbi:hypothetical protein SAMN04489738_2593 [Pseudarthrobacter chlorophenolicus]|nr:hypothetical protein SAMN04489738_2593 [Pseudarthrobacter chlorophenolicus]
MRRTGLAGSSIFAGLAVEVVVGVGEVEAGAGEAAGEPVAVAAGVLAAATGVVPPGSRGPMRASAATPKAATASTKSAAYLIHSPAGAPGRRPFPLTRKILLAGTCRRRA